jgi:hypothetical protein
MLSSLLEDPDPPIAPLMHVSSHLSLNDDCMCVLIEHAASKGCMGGGGDTRTVRTGYSLSSTRFTGFYRNGCWWRWHGVLKDAAVQGYELFQEAFPFLLYVGIRLTVCSSSKDPAQGGGCQHCASSCSYGNTVHLLLVELVLRLALQYLTSSDHRAWSAMQER